MRKIFRLIMGIIVSLVGVILFISLAGIAAFVYSNAAPPFSSDSAEKWEGVTLETDTVDNIVVRFEVRKGESAQSVGQRLAAAGLIRSRYFWYLLCRYYNREPVKSGSYLIEIPANQIAIHRILVSGRQLLMRVTVPEGLTLKKTAALLEEAGICPADKFLDASYDSAIINRYRIPGASMEGYLYPDTYLFPPEYPAEKVVQAMADNFFTRIGEIDEKALSMPPDELNRLVILASIVEREYRLDEEAPVMAGVFFNRLDIGMALQSCATVEYVITEIQGKPHPEILLTRDTEIRDPYNTYRNPGLPPGPIASPGTVSLKAVLSPAKS
ncbi:MAG: endolytic transglycosylase MltG, partial [Treponema sp.]|nr:endolytic transglycosylase MltG [Treponema sp.]